MNKKRYEVSKVVKVHNSPKKATISLEKNWFRAKKKARVYDYDIIREYWVDDGNYITREGKTWYLDKEKGIWRKVA